MPDHNSRAAADGLPFRCAPVGRGNWADLERLFEQRGGPHSCWCMVWRDKAAKKAALAQRVSQGIPVGILGYLGDEPVAWCSVGPRTSFRRLLDEPADETAACVWSIVCFFVRRNYRRRGLTGRLIDAAVSYARSNGANVVEAYPVERSSPSYRFMGFTDHFERAGFVTVGKAGTRRTVMRWRAR